MYTQLELELERQLASALGLESSHHPSGAETSEMTAVGFTKSPPSSIDIYCWESLTTPPRTPPPTISSANGELPPTPGAPRRPTVGLVGRAAYINSGSGVAYPSFRALDFDQ